MPNFDDLAGVLLEGRGFALQFAAEHFDTYQANPTSMAMAHVMRSAVIGQLVQGATDFEIEDSYLDFGRVGVVDPASGATFLLKSRAVIPLECPLPGADPYIDITRNTLFLLAYEFNDDGLTLGVVPAKQIKKQGRTRYRLLDNLRDVGQWSHAGQETTDNFFDQRVDEDWLGRWSDMGESKAGEA